MELDVSMSRVNKIHAKRLITHNYIDSVLDLSVGFQN